MSTKRKDSPSKTELPAKRRPIKVFRSTQRPNISVSVWDRQAQYEGETLTFYSITPQRSYERDGEKQYTSSFDSEDLDELIRLEQDAKAFIETLKHPESMLPKPEGEVIPE